jgi:hypothetical protein
MKINPVSSGQQMPAIRSLDKLLKGRSDIAGKAVIGEELTQYPKEIEDLVDLGSSSTSSQLYSKSSSIIKTEAELRESISAYIALGQELGARGNIQEAQKMNFNASYLSSKLSDGGIITDSLSGQKYFVTNSILLGGGNTPSTASGVSGFSSSDLNSDSTTKVQATLEHLAYWRGCNRQALVIIENQYGAPLQYKAANYTSGYFFSNIYDAFTGTNKTIEPSRCGGIAHTKSSDSACGAVGYISFTVATGGKNYVVCCGYCCPYSGSTSAGIEIRAEDGVTDGQGRITGHGVDATGAVIDSNALVQKQYHQHAKDPERDSTTNESCTPFKVECLFNNKSYAKFHFKVIKNV